MDCSFSVFWETTTRSGKFQTFRCRVVVGSTDAAQSHSLIISPLKILISGVIEIQNREKVDGQRKKVPERYQFSGWIGPCS